MNKKAQQKLINWYQKNKRPLPWRKKQSPYRIWVSEVMLQQTTVRVVIPYYEKFIKKFKNLKALAEAPLEEVLSCWAGLGYYSRAKNMHKSARLIYAQKFFPKTYKELLKLPGFGPYTARAVSSLAFNEKTAVLDANVIRVMSRVTCFQKPWWDRQGRIFLQKQADQWMGRYPSSLMNQALMELGALICTARKPFCFICPLQKHCRAFAKTLAGKIPIPKKQKQKEIWLYRPRIFIKDSNIALTQNHPLPVLKNHPAFPGTALKKTSPPKKYDFVHFITHHAIYVRLLRPYQKQAKSCDFLPKSGEKPAFSPFLWIKPKEIKKQNPSSLMQKILKTLISRA